MIAHEHDCFALLFVFDNPIGAAQWQQEGDTLCSSDFQRDCKAFDALADFADKSAIQELRIKTFLLFADAKVVVVCVCVCVCEYDYYY